MGLQTAVAASLLPASRSRVGTLFKEFVISDSAAASHGVLLSTLAAACGLTESDVTGALASAAAMLSEAGRIGIEPVPWYDARYPVLLSCIRDPPPVLWIRGNPAALARPVVAVVGSRAATDYARQVGERLGGELAERGIVVASGLARGVDSAAHSGCLGAGGETVAVLGSGLDRIYPAEHQDLAANICKQGVLVSELGPGAPPLPEHFPLRNRIISGISLAVVVVEASEKSGSLITARCGLEQGRDVMAVPGSVLSGRNRGSHSLLKDGAKVVESADDILEELGWWPSRAEKPGSGRAADGDPVVGRMEAGELYRLDELMALTGLEGPKLLPRLMELELQGRVATGPGGVWGLRRGSGNVW
jgi:DNA processing protein